MTVFQFGGPLSPISDPVAHISVRPRCSGNVTTGRDVPDDFKAPARACLLRHVAAEIERATRAGKSVLGAERELGFAEAVAAGAGAELGVPLEVTSVSLGFSEADADALAEAAIAGAKAHAAARPHAPASPPQPAAAPGAHSCPSCGAQGAGKFCAHCGAALAPAAAAAAAPAPGPIQPPVTAEAWLAAGINGPLAAGSMVTVPDGHAFVGFAGGAIAFDARASAQSQPLPRTCDNGMYIRITGMPFSFATSVRGRGRLQFRGTWYVRDPVASFRCQQSVSAGDINLLEIVLGRCADKVAGTASDERQLCLATANAYPQDGNDITGTIVVLDAMTPVPE